MHQVTNMKICFTEHNFMLIFCSLLTDFQLLSTVMACQERKNPKSLTSIVQDSWAWEKHIWGNGLQQTLNVSPDGLGMQCTISAVEAYALCMHYAAQHNMLPHSSSSLSGLLFLYVCVCVSVWPCPKP